jgi:hypothetical protein
MKLAIAVRATLFLTALSGHAQTAQEWKLDLARYGLVKGSCAWYPGHLEFLDDDHVVVSAPVAYNCDKNQREKPTETRITEIDLQGHELASVRRTDVVELKAGPIGFVTVCTGDRLELLSRNLQVASSIAVSEGEPPGCDFGGMLSPSRTAMAIWGPAKSHQLRLYQRSLSDPIAEVTLSKGQNLGAVDDDGFLVCVEQRKQCQVVGSHGPVRTFSVPQLGGADGYYIVGLAASDRLLVASFDGKRLSAISPTGETVASGDLAKIKPPFINGSDAQLSAAEPRRALYRVDGCLLGDFDDCYGDVFRHFAVFDSQTLRMLFRHSYAPDADLRISPDGHIVMEREGAGVQFFRLP